MTIAIYPATGIGRLGARRPKGCRWYCLFCIGSAWIFTPSFSWHWQSLSACAYTVSSVSAPREWLRNRDPFRRHRSRFRRVLFDVGGAKWFPAQATVVSTTAMPTISGPARVIDGDTVVVAGIHVRLKGVDAAELGTARGETARAAMIGIVTSDLTCRLTGEKTYRREVGYCTTANGTDINRAIIAQGAALACPRYDDRYVPFEQATALAAQPRSSYCVKRF